MNYKVKNITNGDVTVPYSNTSEVISSGSSVLLLSTKSVGDSKGLAMLIYNVNIDNLIVIKDGIELSKEDSILAIEDTGNKVHKPDTEEYKVFNTSTDDSAVDALMKAYFVKEVDGQNYYRKKRAQLVNKLYTSVLTEAEVILIESKLTEVKSDLLTGDWITAKNNLTSTVAEGAYTEELKTEYLTEITEYITNNY